MQRVRLASLVIGVTVLGTASAPAQTPAAPKPPQAPKANLAEPVGHSATVSSGSAQLAVDLSDGSRVMIALAGGTLYLNAQRAGTYQRGGALERAWRSILSKAGDLSTPELVFALHSLPAPAGEPGAQQAMAAINAALPVVSKSALPGLPPDVAALATAPAVNLDSINELARGIAGAVAAREAARALRAARAQDGITPAIPGAAFSVSRLATDVAGLFGTLVALASLGFGALFFVPQRLELVAATVRRSPIRSFFAGLFAQPLLLPALVTLCIGLILTIVGILVVPVAIVAYILAVAAALVGGYLSVALVVGEIYARRRGNGNYTTGWMTYRTLMYGLVGLLAIWAPGVLMRSVPVAGDILLATALVFTWVMATTGFGAAILSKAGGGWKLGAQGQQRELSSEYMWTSTVPARPTEARKGSV